MAEPRPADRLTLDLITSYLAAAAKVGSWAVVLAVVARLHPPELFAYLVLVRTVFAFLNYAHLGIPSLLVRRLAVARSERAEIDAAIPIEVSPGTVLNYASAQNVAAPVDARPEARIAAAASSCVLFAFGFGTAILFATSFALTTFLAPSDAKFGPVPALFFTVLLGIGWLVRSLSDIPAAWLVHRGQLWRDNLYQILIDTGWVAVVLLFGGAGVLLSGRSVTTASSLSLTLIGGSFMMLAFALAQARASWLPRSRGDVDDDLAPSVRRETTALFRAGLPVTLGNLADYLYGPVSMLVVAAFLTTQDAAAYGVAIYFDSVLLLLVAGVAAPLLPRIADASARHDIARVRKLYITAMLACLGVLALAATCVVLFAPWILTVWLKNPPPGVTAVLPIVLLHTVIGGTAGVARSVLVGIGAHRAYAVSALVGGLLNVALGLLFVTQFDMGLAGIAWATVIAVALRCAVWMPWFVLRRLRPAL